MKRSGGFVLNPETMSTTVANEAASFVPSEACLPTTRWI
jgi:hypothetical protein